MSVVPFTEQDLHDLYTWVDQIPLSRPKKSISRDFADGCCVAEIMKFFFPKLVDVHNYVPSMSRGKKLDNWNTLNARVFRKLYFEVPAEEVEDIIAAVPGAIERFLRALRIKLTEINERRDSVGASVGRARSAESEEAPEREEEERGGAYFDSKHAYPAATSLTVACARSAGARLSKEPPGSRAPAQPAARLSAPSASAARGASATGDDGKTEKAARRELRGGRASTPASSSPRQTGSKSGSAELVPVEEFTELLAEKDRTIAELRETVAILSEKTAKLEELVCAKDEKLSQYRIKFGRL